MLRSDGAGDALLPDDVASLRWCHLIGRRCRAARVQQHPRLQSTYLSVTYLLVTYLLVTYLLFAHVLVSVGRM